MQNSKSITVSCGNKYCDNKEARVDQVCGNSISQSDPDCDYINYEIAKPVYSLSLIFLLPDVPGKMEEQISEFEEINVDLKGLKSAKEAVAFLRQSPEAEDYGKPMCDYLASLLISWGSTFGIQSELNPEPNEIEGPKFWSIELIPEDDEIQVTILIEMYLQSHQHDMLEWYGSSLAETLMAEEDLVWIHMGHRIILKDVEV